MISPIALFFDLLFAFTSGCQMNQYSLTADDSLSVIGALLQKVCLLFVLSLFISVHNSCFCVEH